MTPAERVSAFLLWSILLASGAFYMGVRFATGQQAAGEVTVERKEAVTVRKKNTRALAVGVQTQKAQEAADAAFQHIRTEYEPNQNMPGIGCVLDPVSLRLWNEANAQSDGNAPSQSDDELPAAAEGAAGSERGEQPYRRGPVVPPLPEQGGGLD